MKSFLDFVKEKKASDMNVAAINEAFSLDDVSKAHELMLDLFNKKLNGRVIQLSPVQLTTAGHGCMSLTYMVTANNKIDVVWNINYLMSGGSAEVYSVDIFDAEQGAKMLFGDGNAKSAITINTLGQSVAYFLPLIIDIVKTKKFNISTEEATTKAKTVFAKESKMHYIGAQAYRVYEGLNDDTIVNAFHIANGHHIVNNGEDFVWESEADDVRRRVRTAERESWKTKNDSPEARERSLALDREYRELCKAINGGATTLEEIEVSIGHKVSVMYNNDDTVIKAENELKTNSSKKSPEQAFKEMQGYVKTVIKGIQPGVILCGAPGIGKTYRVMQQLKANGFQYGQNLAIIKGKATPRQMYLTIYDYKDKGNIILIDDADALVGPKAPEDVINILKAALDSTADDEGRLVSYKVSGKLEDDEGNPIPKTCYANCGIIVLTNYSAGQLDTAIRNRVFVQTLDFTNEQLLNIVKQIMPDISPAQLSMDSKYKAYDYLMEMAQSGSDMQISIRSFTTCARIFQVCDTDAELSDEDARSMICEQMKLQAVRGGKKF